MHPLLITAWLAAPAFAQEAPAPSPSDSPTTDQPADAAASPEPTTPAPPSPATVRVVYTGALGGIGAGRYLFEGVRQLWRVDEDLDEDLEALRVYHGVLTQGDVALHATDGRVETVVAALDGPTPPVCGPATPKIGVSGALDVTLLDPGATALIDALGSLDTQTAPWTQSTCTAENGSVVHLFAPQGSAPPDWSLGAWEFRRGLVGRVGDHEVRMTTAPIQETARVFGRAMELKAEDVNAIYVDAGGFVDGASSVQNAALSLHRPLGYSMLERLEPAALVPGRTELIRGAARFFAEQADRDLPYIATNWSAQDPALELPDHRIQTVQTDAGPVRLAFVGVLDPALLAQAPELVAEGISIGDPVTAVQPVIDALYDAPEPPDAVIALTTAQGPVLEHIRRDLRGVDVLAGDPTLATLRIAMQDATLRDLPPHAKGAPLTTSLDGLATLELGVDDVGLRTVRTTPQLISSDSPQDPLIQARVTQVRAETYPFLDRPLVPAADADDPSAAWSEDAWSQLVCESLRHAHDADSVLLRALPAPSRVPGPLTELLVVDQVAALDELQIHRIPGDKLANVLNKAYGVVPVSCGAVPGASSPKARGRSLDSARTYRLLTTDRTLEITGLGDILTGVSATGPLDGPAVVTPRGQAGYPLTLRAGVLQALRAVRSDAASDADRDATELSGDTPADLAVRAFMADAASWTPPLWLLRVRELSASVSRFNGVDDSAYAEVPETLASSPSSLTLTSTGDVAVEYSSSGVAWDLRHRHGLTTLATTVDGVTTEAETADDLRWSTSVELPLATFPRQAAVQWAPFSEVLYDTEFNPSLTSTSGTRQSDLSLTLGLDSNGVWVVDSLRVGAFANRDMAQLDTKPTEYGGRFELSADIGLGDVAAWSTQAEGYLWARTADDDASDLRWKTVLDTTVAFPLARWLDIAVGGEVFALQGRVPETATPGVAWTLGAALDMSGAFEL